MTKALSGAVLLCLAVGTSSRADVTVRYSYDVRPGPMFPPQLVEKMKTQIHEMIGSSVPMQVKGNRAVSTVMGLTSISDFDGEIITLVDSKNKRYATAQKEEYLRAFLKSQEQHTRAIPEQARKAIEQTKTDVKSELTGRKETIYGIETEERQVTMSMGRPGTPPIRMVFVIYSPTNEQVERNPMLREWRMYAQRAYPGTGPGTAAEKMMSQSPGMGPGADMISAFKESAVILRMRMSMIMPVPPNAPERPAMEMVMNLDEMSAAAIPDSAFAIPRDYTVVSMDELIAGMYEKFRPKTPAVVPVAP